MRFHCLDVQHKARMLAHTLLQAGHEHVPAPQADVLLIDIDDPDAPMRSRLISQCSGAVVLYQHGGIPSTYHGFYKPDERVHIQLVHGPGGARLARQLKLGRNVVTVGWSYSPTVVFKPIDAPRSVLFGPSHPYGSGRLEEHYKKLNGRVYQLLRKSGMDLRIQMFGTAAANGLPMGVTGHRSTLMLDWSQIDQADLVVAEGTLACLALARGKPVITFGQQFEPTDEHNRPSRGPVIRVPRYPVDIDDGPLDELVDGACIGLGEAWRRKFVGGPFDHETFLAAIESSVLVAA